MQGDAGSRIDKDANDALAAFGLVHVGEVPDNSIDVWPENWKAVEVFVAMSTQWNTTFQGGIIGLRYEALPAVMRYCAIPRAEQADVFHGLRIMEHAALESFRDGR